MQENTLSHSHQSLSFLTLASHFLWLVTLHTAKKKKMERIHSNLAIVTIKVHSLHGPIDTVLLPKTRERTIVRELLPLQTSPWVSMDSLHTTHAFFFFLNTFSLKL